MNWAHEFKRINSILGCTDWCIFEPHQSFCMNPSKCKAGYSDSCLLYCSIQLILFVSAFQYGSSLHHISWVVYEDTDPRAFDLLVNLVELQCVSHLSYRRWLMLCRQNKMLLYITTKHPEGLYQAWHLSLVLTVVSDHGVPVDRWKWFDVDEYMVVRHAVTKSNTDSDWGEKETYHPETV